MNIEHISFPAYNLQTNKVERFQGNLTKLLTVELEREDINWISKLSAIKLTYILRYTGL